MEGKLPARIGAIVFVAIAVTATAIEMTRKDEAPASPPAGLVQPQHDPLRDAQRRCQQLGATAASDAECLRVWAETRDRFLRQPSAPASPEGR